MSSSTSGSNMISWRQLRGSNCVKISIGQVSPYDMCMGCNADAAMNCIDDMRLNISGTVAANCIMDGISETDKVECCPTYISLNSGSTLIPNFYSSAYPHGMSCMRSVGCGDSVLYKEIYNECLNVCGLYYKKTGRNITATDISSRCTAIFSSASWNNRPDWGKSAKKFLKLHLEIEYQSYFVKYLLNTISNKEPRQLVES
eukprot:gene5942-11991_t